MIENVGVKTNKLKTAMILRLGMTGDESLKNFTVDGKLFNK